MKNIAILGYGTVGSGVFEVLEMNREKIEKRLGEEFKIKYVLDLKPSIEGKAGEILTDDFDKLLADEDLDCVVETMGGVEPAYTFSESFLKKGKVVVSSNKELVEKHGAKLMQVAKENGGKYLFEASVGGGIPIIRPLSVDLIGNEINSIRGIVNGTSNYIMTMMDRENWSFEEALKSAQELGYAEANPDADVKGHDSSRKIAIMTSIATGKDCSYADIYTEGIDKIAKTDMAFAKSLEMTIKLIVRMEKEDDKISVMVSPLLISKDSKLGMINDVFNGVMVDGNALGEALFYGQGAGKLATASAVVGDIVDGLYNDKYEPLWTDEALEIVKKDDMKVKALVIFTSLEENVAKIEERFGVEVLKNESDKAFFTETMTERDLDKLVKELDEEFDGVELRNVIRTGE